jgi:hypothetical protein
MKTLEDRIRVARAALDFADSLHALRAGFKGDRCATPEE